MFRIPKKDLVPRTPLQMELLLGYLELLMGILLSTNLWCTARARNIASFFKNESLYLTFLCHFGLGRSFKNNI